MMVLMIMLKSGLRRLDEQKSSLSVRQMNTISPYCSQATHAKTVDERT